MENLVSNPLVSVLIPTFNRAEEIRKTLRSIFENNFSNLEIIVFDNKSTDNTKKVVENFSKNSKQLKYFCQPKNLGPLENWKSALNVSKGKYVHWLWSDDWVESDFYIKMTKRLEKDSSTIAFCSVKTVNLEDNWEKITYSYLDGVYDSKQFLKKYIKGFEYPVSPAACLLRRDHCSSILNDFFVPDTKNINVNDYGTGYDAVMIMEGIFNSLKVSLVNKQLVNFRFHKNSISVTESGLGNQTRYAHSRLLWVKKNNLGLWCARYDLLRLIYFRKYHELFHYMFNKSLLIK